MSEHLDVAPGGGPDTRPAFTGLIIGAIALFALVYSIVVVTNKHYEATETPPAATS
jgi:hypothetical protein